MGFPCGPFNFGCIVSVDYYFIGDPELVIAFRFTGIKGQAVEGAEDALAAFRRMTEGVDAISGLIIPGIEKCRVLILTEEVANWAGDYLIQWQLSDKYPLIVEIPGMMGYLPGRKSLVETIREAIGLHV